MFFQTLILRSIRANSGKCAGNLAYLLYIIFSLKIRQKENKMTVKPPELKKFLIICKNINFIWYKRGGLVGLVPEQAWQVARA